VERAWADVHEDDLAIASPDGTTVRFRLASPSDRVTAFLIDLFVTQLASAIALIAVLLLVNWWSREIAHAVFLIVSFFFRNVYFTASELIWSGQTLGKRRVGLRVISRDGGPLTGQAILARNLTREIEFFLPLVALTSPGQLGSLDERWNLVLGAGWLAVFALLPLLNRERLRCGDLVGGTVVVRLPRRVLLPDLAERTQAQESRYVFTPAQLAIYGIEELQILERVLHRATTSPYDELTRVVAARIQRKIAWTSDGPDDAARFLRDFYQALRAQLERKLLFGVRKERKEL
jgi:uncharacterized RDD family membrane protein YckC